MLHTVLTAYILYALPDKYTHMPKAQKEVAVQWAKKQISLTQVCNTLKVLPSTAYSILARALKEIHYGKSK